MPKRARSRQIKYKKPKQTFTASHTFPIRNRCSNCGKCQLQFYRDATNAQWPANLRYSRNRHNQYQVMSWIEYSNGDYVWHAMPQYKKHGWGHTHAIGWKRFDPKMFRTFTTWDGRYPMGSEVVMIVCGNCGVQRWAYMSDRKSLVPEIANRKARIKLPIEAVPLNSKFW